MTGTSKVLAWLVLALLVGGCGDKDPEEATYFHGAWRYADGTGAGDLGLLVVEPGGSGALGGKPIRWSLGKPIPNPMGPAVHVIRVTVGEHTFRFQQHPAGLMEGESGAGATWREVTPEERALSDVAEGLAGTYGTDVVRSAEESLRRDVARLDPQSPGFQEMWGSLEAYETRARERLLETWGTDGWLHTTLRLLPSREFALTIGSGRSQASFFGTWRLTRDGYVLVSHRDHPDARIRVDGRGFAVRLYTHEQARYPADIVEPRSRLGDPAERTDTAYLVRTE